MISDFLKKLPFLNRAGLKESVLATLEKGGYSVDGTIFFRNYHQVYCGVKAPDGKTIGSAWQFSLKKGELLLIGGNESELPAEVIPKLSFPPKEILYELSPSSFSMNPAWREACLENIKKADKTFGRGCVVSVDRTLGEQISVGKAALSSFMITDGQRGMGVDDRGCEVRFPRAIRLISEVDNDLPIVTAQTIKSDVDRSISAQFLAMDLTINYPGKEFSAVSLRSKPPYSRDDANMLIVSSEDKMIACVSGTDYCQVVKEALRESNVENGFPEDFVINGRGSHIQIDYSKLDEIIDDLSMVTCKI